VKLFIYYRYFRFYSGYIYSADKTSFNYVNKSAINKKTFNIIEFNSTAHKLFSHAVSATQRNKVSAKRFIRHLSVDGGTEMAAALNLAFEYKQLDE